MFDTFKHDFVIIIGNFRLLVAKITFDPLSSFVINFQFNQSYFQKLFIYFIS